MADGRWRLPVNARTEVDPGYLKLLMAYEDRRFRSHAGVDPLALGRAALQLASRGHIVSGGSTITMQLARLLEPRRARSVHAKLRQMVRALEIERQLTKDQILDLYLTLAPYGGNLEGIRAASIAYFGKEPKRLSLAEAALLVALPQSPETRRLDRHPGAARAARDRVLDRMVEEHQVSVEDAVQAKAVPVPRLRKPMPILAPHSADQATSLVKDAPVIRLTLEAGLQKVLETLARDRAAALGPTISVGILAVDNDSGDALAGIAPDPLHLRTSLRRRFCASREPDRRPPHSLRLLRAGKFRHDLPGYGAGAQSPATLAERAGDCLARSRRRQPAVVAAETGGRQSGAAEGRSA